MNDIHFYLKPEPVFFSNCGGKDSEIEHSDAQPVYELPEKGNKMSLKNIFCLAILLLLCSACVSRTISEPVGPDEDNTVKETKLIWIWDKEFHNP